MKDVVFFDNNSFFQGNEKVYIQLSTEFPEYVGIMHRHQFIEVVYILSGSAIHTVGGREYKIESGDVALINSNTDHKFTPDSSSKEPFVAYDLMFSPDFFDSSVIDMSDFGALKNSFLFFSLFPSEDTFFPDMHIKGNGFGGYGEHYLYGPFHGNGLMEGEAPWVETSSDYLLEENMTFCSDIFLGSHETKRGIRIEDVVRITKDGCENLTNFPRKLFEL